MGYHSGHHHADTRPGETGHFVVDWDGSYDPSNPRKWLDVFKMIYALLVNAYTLYS